MVLWFLLLMMMMAAPLQGLVQSSVTGLSRTAAFIRQYLGSRAGPNGRPERYAARRMAIRTPGWVMGLCRDALA
jgi:hypothetical protein